MTNVLYLGMADDILTPFMLVSDISNIYVINCFDDCYSKDGTWQTMKDDIKTSLINGNDSKSYGRSIFVKDDPDEPIHRIDHKATIIFEEEYKYETKDKKGKEEIVWRLKFWYNQKKINLIYFHERNFFDVWPKEIQNIKHVMGMGAFLWNPHLYRYIEEQKGIKMIHSYLKERAILPFKLYGCEYFHRHFDTFVHIDQDFEKEYVAIQEIADYETFIETITPDPDTNYYTSDDEYPSDYSSSEEDI